MEDPDYGDVHVEGLDRHPRHGSQDGIVGEGSQHLEDHRQGVRRKGAFQKVM